jgi:8-oxo-dGTP pyrophosphatase MutT (NUDIX family)
METKGDISYGIVPLYKKGETWEVLLIHQISYRGDDFWIFPKGHAEGMESPQVAALRELAEETGITDVTLEPDKIFPVSYSFTHENVRINKTVEYRIGYCESKKTTITQPHEIKEIRWCDFETADALLSHQNSKDVLEKVGIFLNQLSK